MRTELFEGPDSTHLSSEMAATDKQKKRILFLVNRDIVIYNFRAEIVEKLLADGHDVHISSPYGERIDALTAIGAQFHDITMRQREKHFFEGIYLLAAYCRLMKEVKPDIVFGFTVKPNIFGAMAAHRCDIPFVANITGLGTALEKKGFTQNLLLMLYRFSFRYVRKVFFQNTANRDFFLSHRIPVSDSALLPGSGVNLSRFPLRDYPPDDVVRFAFVSRILEEKGIDIYLNAAKAIEERYDHVEFHVCGFFESDYHGKLQQYADDGVIIYHGLIRDVSSFMQDIHCIVHPSYYPEGISNVLLEACASGRPMITTDNTGCREVVEDGVNGFMIPQRDTAALIGALEQFIRLPWSEKREMGLNARRKAEREYDRRTVVEAYVNEVNKA